MESLKEVFCEECEHHIWYRERGRWGGEHQCTHIKNMIIKNAAISRYHTKEFAKCYKVNRINDCILFEKRISLWNRFKNWVRK